MSGGDENNQQAQAVDISDDSKITVFEQTEIVESMNELAAQEKLQQSAKD